MRRIKNFLFLPLLFICSIAFALDTGFLPPTFSVAGGGWTNGANALLSDNVYTVGDGVAAEGYKNFGFSIPANAVIVGIEVAAEGTDSLQPPEDRTSSGVLAQLSWDNGSTFSDTRIDATIVSGPDQTKTLGGAADLWGHSWTPSEFSNANFVLRIRHAGNDETSIDQLLVKIYYTAGSVAC